MLRRTRAREIALQLLFQRDQNPKAVPRAAVERFARERLDDSRSVKFALALYDGVNAQREVIDALLTSTATNWRLQRMLPSDRNVLRLGVFELQFAQEREPVPVVLNEAIELSRRFGTEDSPAFVNGVLDKIAKATPAVPVPNVAQSG